MHRHPRDCPLFPQMEASERTNEQHGSTHRELFDRLRELERLEGIRIAKVRDGGEGGAGMSGTSVKVCRRAKEENTTLSRNFKVRESACRNGSDTVFVAPELVTVLQKIRDHFGKAVNINSGRRRESYDALQNGAAYSQHKYGAAVDISVSGMTPARVAAYAEVLLPGKGGIGIYSRFTHMDVRAVKSRRKG